MMLCMIFFIIQEMCLKAMNGLATNYWVGMNWDRNNWTHHTYTAFSG